MSGLCAALAATIDPPAIVFLLLLPAVIFAIRWTPMQRFAGLAVYLLGAALPLVLHGSLSSHATANGFRVRGPAGNESLFSFVNPDSRTTGPAYDLLPLDMRTPLILLTCRCRRPRCCGLGGEPGLSPASYRWRSHRGGDDGHAPHWPWTTRCWRPYAGRGGAAVVLFTSTGRLAWRDVRVEVLSCSCPVVSGAPARRRRAIAWGAALRAGVQPRRSIVGATAPPRTASRLRGSDSNGRRRDQDLMQPQPTTPSPAPIARLINERVPRR